MSADNDFDGKMMTVSRLARLLNVGEGKIRQLARDDLIPSLRVGPSTLRFDFQLVMQALERASRQPSSVSVTKSVCPACGEAL